MENSRPEQEKEVAGAFQPSRNAPEELLRHNGYYKWRAITVSGQKDAV